MKLPEKAGVGWVGSLKGVRWGGTGQLKRPLPGSSR